MSEESGAVVELREELAVLVAALAERDVVIEQLRAENAELRRLLGSASRRRASVAQ